MMAETERDEGHWLSGRKLTVILRQQAPLDGRSVHGHAATRNLLARIMSFVHSPPDPPYALLTVDPSFRLQPAADRQFRTGRRRKRRAHTDRSARATTRRRRPPPTHPRHAPCRGQTPAPFPDGR